MRVLVTGSSGQLGCAVVRELKRRNIDFFASERKDMDITNYVEVKECISGYSPDAIIHCAAYTAVDRAESESKLCETINTAATENLSRLCKEINAVMIYVSTDYVFMGNNSTPYETEDETQPLNVYGKTKLMGERAVSDILGKYFIVRTSWLYGIDGNNFVKTMIKLGKELKEIKVVSDQIGSPTYAEDLAGLLCDMLFSDKYGIYHATGSGACSWYEFAKEIFLQSNIDVVVCPITTEEYCVKAKRPKYSVLSNEKLIRNGFKPFPPWRDSLTHCISKM